MKFSKDGYLKQYVLKNKQKNLLQCIFDMAPKHLFSWTHALP